MVQFILPLKTKQQGKSFYAFAVPKQTIMFAGSRNLDLAQHTCRLLIQLLATLGFGFFIGCAAGVDQSFRKALSESRHKEKAYVACAFPNRTKPQYSGGLFAALVVPRGLHPKAALHRRTLWMVKRSSMLFLFPDNPQTGTWGKGSTLAFNSTLLHLKPVFVATNCRIPQSVNYIVIPADFFGIISGYWVIPHTIKQGGPCDYEY